MKMEGGRKKNFHKIKSKNAFVQIVQGKKVGGGPSARKGGRLQLIMVLEVIVPLVVVVVASFGAAS